MALAVATGVTDGVLALDKPAGWTSHDVVAKLRGLFRIQKVGHAGTLDPDATGVLPILIGQATRVAEHLVGWDKEYRAVLRLGAVTDTQDASGEVLARHPVPALTLDQVEAVVQRFEGAISQVPPMYSAVKVDGVPLYRAARAGKTIAREARTVTIHAVKVLGVEGADVHLHVHCSKGTYIRTLCADVGEALGCGGHLLSLRRTRVGPLLVERALTLEDVSRHVKAGTIGESLWSMNDVLSDLPAVVVDDVTAGRVLHGVSVSRAAVQGAHAWDRVRAGASVLRILDERGRLLALGSVPAASALGGSEGEAAAIRIRKVFAGQE